MAIAALALAFAAFRVGPVAVWLAIALLILGPLAIAAILPVRDLQGMRTMAILAEVVRLKRFWIMVVVSISINVCWHFLVNWIPAYLKTERNLAGSLGNYLTAVTFLAADFGNLGGGWLSRWLAPRAGAPTRARKLVMSLCIVMILSGPAMSIPMGDARALVLLSIMSAGTAAFMANYFAFTQEVSPLHTGFVVGYLGAVGNLFVAGYQPIAGSLRDVTGSFTANFLIVGLTPLVGISALLWGWGHDSPAASTIKQAGAIKHRFVQRGAVLSTAHATRLDIRPIASSRTRWRIGSTSDRTSGSAAQQYAVRSSTPFCSAHSATGMPSATAMASIIFSLLVDSPLMGERLGGDSSPRLLCARRSVLSPGLWLAGTPSRGTETMERL